MRIRLFIVGIIVFSFQLFAQEQTIEVCFGGTEWIQFTTDDPEGIHEYEWFIDQGNGYRLEGSQRRYIISDQFDGSLIFGREITDECTVIVSDTFNINTIGINTTRAEDIFNLEINPLINGPSKISVKAGYEYLVDPTHPSRPDSLWIEFNNYPIPVQIDKDTVHFTVPVVAFQPPAVNTTTNDTTRRISYSISAIWDKCGRTNFSGINSQWDKSNFLNFTEDRTGRFFISGLLDTLKAGQNLNNLVGALDRDNENITAIVRMEPLNNTFMEITEALISVDSLDLVAGDPFYFGIQNGTNVPSILPTGNYKISLEGYANTLLQTIYFDSTELYYVNNDPTIYGFADIQPIEYPYMGDPEHTLEMTYYSGPVMRFVNASLEYFFLSENKQDTFKIDDRFSLPYTDVDDTTTFTIDIKTGTNLYQYDTIYFEFIDSLNTKQFVLAAATNMYEDIIRSRNAYVSQLDDQGTELEGYIVGDSTFSDGDVLYSTRDYFPQTELFTEQTQTLPSDSIIGDFYTLSGLDSIYLKFDLGLNYNHFYELTTNADSIGLEWEMDLYVDYVAALNVNPADKIERTKAVAAYSSTLPFTYDANGESTSTVKVNIPKQTITNYDPLATESSIIRNNYTLSEERYFIKFYLKGDSIDNILDLKSDFSISDTLTFEIIKDEIIYGDIDLGFVQDYPFYTKYRDGFGKIRPTGYVERYPIYLWNAQHNSHRLFTYTVPAPDPNVNAPEYYEKFNYEADLNFAFADSLANVEVAIYSTTQAFNDLVLDMVGTNPRSYRYGQEFDNYGPGFLDRIEKMVRNQSGGNFLKNFHHNEEYFTLEKIDILDNLNNYRANPDFNIDVMYDTLAYDPNKRSYIFVIDPNNKVLETNEENNIYFHNIHEYCDTGVDLTIAEPTSSFYAYTDFNNTEYKSFEVSIRDYNLMEDVVTNRAYDFDGLIKVNDGEKITAQFIVRNNGTLPSSAAELNLRAFPIAPALPDSITLIRSDEDFQKYWNRSIVVGTWPVSAFTNYVGTNIDYRERLDGGNVPEPMGEVLQLELDPSTFVPPGNSFFLLADLVSPEDCITGVNDRTWGSKGYQPSGYRNKRIYSIQQLLVGSPNIILENFEYTDFEDIECGSDFRVRFDVTNIEPDFSSFNDFYIYIEDNLGNQDTLTFNGIGAGESIVSSISNEIILPNSAFPEESLQRRVLSSTKSTDFVYQVDLTLDLRNINVPDTIKNYIIQDEMTVKLVQGSIGSPSIITNNGKIMAWEATGQNPIYTYNAIWEPRDFTKNTITRTGTTTSTSLNLASMGIPYEYGTYTITVSAEDDYCGWSYEVGDAFEYTPPPPPSKSSGGGSGESGETGGSGGGGCDISAETCVAYVTSCVIIDTRYEEAKSWVSDKYWMKFQNIYNQTVEATFCIDNDCGQTTLSPGETHTWWSYGVGQSPGRSIKFDFCR